MTTAKELPLIALIMQVRILLTNMDQALRIIKTSITPTLEHKDGFVGLFTMVNHESKELVCLSLWENERALRAIEASGFVDQQAAKLSSVVAEAITGTTYEFAQAPHVYSRKQFP